MQSSFVRVLGSADWHQTGRNDHSCYTVDDRILIDACPSVVTHLLENGIDPLDISTICMTHMHCDHAMGLAPLVHYWRVCCDAHKDLSRLTLIGPKAALRTVFEYMLKFVFGDAEQLASCVHRLPALVELEGENILDLPGYRLRVMDSDHAVPGLCYRFERLDSNHSVGFSGDTAYRDAYPRFFAGCDLLVHEASFGAGPVTPENNRICRHSSAQEAAHICREGNVKSLLLSHCYEPKRGGAVEEAKRLLDIPVQWAMPWNCFPY